MAGHARFQKIQMGAETTAGTAVPATTIWRGKGNVEDMRERVFVEENIGIIPPGDRSYISKYGAQLAMEEIPATFEQLPYIGMAGIKSVTGVADDGGSGYIYTFPVSLGTVNAIKTYTIEGGDDHQAYEMEYAFVTDFRLVGAVWEALRMSATWLGRQLQAASFTTSLSLPTVEDILFTNASLAIDDSGDTHGDTPITDGFRSIDLAVRTGYEYYKNPDGTYVFTGHTQGLPEVTLDVKLPHDTTAVAEYGNWGTGAIRLIQLKFEGSTLTTAGTTYSKKTAILNLTGQWDKFAKLEEEDANSMIPATFRCVYNATDAHYAEMIVVNELSSLP